jgi:hypothetical protein
MKCSICNTENPPDAKNCQQCGFSFSIGQPAWPDFPTVEIPQPTSDIQWPELPGVEIPATVPQPAWPIPDMPTPSITPIEIKSTPVQDQLKIKEEAAAVEPPPPDQPSEDDELARAHIARGFEAIRKELLDQAQWEFEQARDLADSEDIVHMAQAQLAGLRAEQAERVELLPPTPFFEVKPTAQPAQRQIRPLERPTAPPAFSQIQALDWRPLVRIGLMLGLVNGVLTGCGAVACLGFLLSPASGFVAGWLAARSSGAARQNVQSANTMPAIIAGGIAGLGGWLGEVIGHPIWVASTSTSSADPLATGVFVACMPGTLYIILAIIGSVLGWRVGTPKE